MVGYALLLFCRISAIWLSRKLFDLLLLLPQMAKVKMLTKYYLHIGATDYELKDDDLRNWDEIRCSYKRASYDGVVRSFTSQFEFVNRAKELLMELYIKDRYNAQASISVHTINDRWEYIKAFECPLDFSTVVWETYTFKINSVDNSLAALIKANKSTKYEFGVGSEIRRDATFLFNRLPIKEALTYEITEGNSNEIDGSLTVPASENGRTYCGVLSDDEIYIGGSILWNDDQTKDPGSYMFEALKDVDVNVDIRIEYDQCIERSNGMDGSFAVIRANGYTETIGGYRGSFNFGSTGKHKCGDYDSEAALRAEWPHSSIYVNGSPKEGYWATVKGIVWAVRYKGSGERTDWENQRVTVDTFRRQIVSWKDSVSLYPGDRIAFITSGAGAHVYSSSFYFSWYAKGSACHIPAFTPQTVAESLLLKLSDGKINPRVFISNYDSRVVNTIILAAESIRDIPGAKLYTSFNEFCDWMSTVFGYVYYIGKEVDSAYKSYKEALGGCTGTNYPLSSESWYANGNIDPTPEDIIYFEGYGKFAAYDGHKWYASFPGDESYNSPETGLARTDTIFKIKRWQNGVQSANLYYFESGNYSPIEYRGNANDIYKKFQAFYFVHRSEILNPNANVRKFRYSRGLKYGVDTSVIYSTVTAGYDKKDYESVNGRDEFNFNNTYTTGCTVSDKTLSLLSKYRADCYGIEFAAQKRGADSTDSTSDKDVFFVLSCKSDEGLLIPDTSCEIQNAASNELFNGAFSPMACIRANAGYIGLQAEKLNLTFASSTGNSSVVIDGEPMTSNIELDTPLATCGVIEFTTDEVDDIVDVDELIEVVDDGVLYRGFLKEVDLKYARTEAAKYKLIVKDIEI